MQYGIVVMGGGMRYHLTFKHSTIGSSLYRCSHSLSLILRFAFSLSVMSRLTHLFGTKANSADPDYMPYNAVCDRVFSACKNFLSEVE